jgi:hypothetical protein
MIGAVSQVIFRPDGAHLFDGREFTPICLRKGFLKRGFLGGAQLKHGLIFARQLQEDSGKVVLYFRGEAAHGLNCLFEQFGHG